MTPCLGAGKYSGSPKWDDLASAHPFEKEHQMANWRCDDCGLDMMEDSPTGVEPCPRCGKDMIRNDGVVLKNFGGGGVNEVGQKES
jgi:predicted RNA-binding Zn-ribbon protein involved in translation (DUF1610 family)